MRRTWVLAVVLALAAAACGDDDPGTAGQAITTTEANTTTTTGGSAATGAGGDGSEPADAGDGGATFPVTVGGATIEQRPERVVSLSPTATEVLFAVGAGDQVVAVDELSNHPPEAPTTALSGFEPNLEAVASYDPDLVVLSYDPGEVVAGLRGIGVPVVLQPPATSLDDAYAQIEQLGAATGHPDRAAQVVADMRSRVEQVTASLDRPERPLRLYHEVDDSFYSVTSSTFLGELYQLLGLENIADAADTAGVGYPQLNAEYIIEADPDVIVVPDEVGYGPDDVAARPGWDQITAVAEGNIVEVDADLASRWGPRVVEFLELMAQRISDLQPADA